MVYKIVGADTDTSLFPPRVMSALSKQYQPQLTLLSIATTAIAPVPGYIQPYNATAGALAPQLPVLSGLTTGSTWLAVQKAAVDTSTNAINLTCAGTDTFDSGVTNITLKAPGEIRTLQVVSVAGTKYWKVIGGNTPLNYLDNTYEPIGLSTTTQSLLKTSYARQNGWLVITDPQWGGADQNGDWSSAISLAKTATSSGSTVTVFFPPGDYRINNGIQHSVNGVLRLVGSGMGYVGNYRGTRLFRDSGTNPIVNAQGAAIGSVNPVANVYNPPARTRVELYDLELHGGNLAGEVLTIFRGQQCTIERVRVGYSTVVGVHLTQLFNTAISKLYVGYCGNGTSYPAFKLDGTAGEGTAAGSNTVKLNGCEFETNAGTDIYIDGSSSDSAATSGILFSDLKIERNTGEYPWIYLGYCANVHFSNLYGYVQSAAATMIQQAGTTGPNHINGATLANGGSSFAYLVDHTAGSLHLTDIHCAGTPTSAYIHVSSTVAYNVHASKNITGDQPTKIYLDQRGTGQLGYGIRSLAVQASSMTPALIGTGGAGYAFPKTATSGTTYVTGMSMIPEDAVVGGAGYLQIRFAASTTSGGNVGWIIQCLDVTADGSQTAATALTTISSGFTAVGTVALRYVDIGGSGITVNPGHAIRWLVYRNGGNSSDTYADTVYVLDVRLQYQKVV